MSDDIKTQEQNTKEKESSFFLLQGKADKIYSATYLAFYSKVNRFLAKCRIDHKKSGCHIFRHSFGDCLVSQGVDLKIIQELLGHSNITTTSKFYTRASDEVKVSILNSVL
ncbi:tyrosine-type recombinase/integrase [Helicobacter sp. 'CLO3_human']|nr:tyrosine-type recombinase/integrase [Helicobacter sp. 'CLO3_human']